MCIRDSNKTSWMAVARPAAFAQLVLLLFAFVVLTIGFVTQDFSIVYVAENSNTLLPMVCLLYTSRCV